MSRPRPLGSLAERVVLVTGAARGIGRAACHAVAEAGAEVIAADLDEAELEETARLVRNTGRRAVPLAMDVTDPDAVDEGFDRGLEELGRPDGPRRRLRCREEACRIRTWPHDYRVKPVIDSVELSRHPEGDPCHT